MTNEAKAQQDEIHLAVGVLIASWANAESAFSAIAARLLGTDDTGATLAYFSLSSNYARMNFLKALAQERLDEPRVAELDKLIDRFKNPTRTRNELAHAEYVLDLDTLAYTETCSIVTTELDKRPMRISKPFDKNRMNEIKTATQNIGELNRSIWQFYKTL